MREQHRGFQGARADVGAPLALALEAGQGVAKDADAARIVQERGRCLFEHSLRRDAGTCPAMP